MRDRTAALYFPPYLSCSRHAPPLACPLARGVRPHCGNAGRISALVAAGRSPPQGGRVGDSTKPLLLQPCRSAKSSRRPISPLRGRCPAGQRGVRRNANYRNSCRQTSGEQNRANSGLNRHVTTRFSDACLPDRARSSPQYPWSMPTPTGPCCGRHDRRISSRHRRLQPTALSEA